MRKAHLVSLILTLLIIGCSSDGEEMTELQTLENGNTLYKTLLSKKETLEKRPQPQIWADCKVYSGIVTPAIFKPTSHSFDELYVMPENTFKNGFPLISDSKPGDQDYNGGRWHLNVLKEGVDPGKYANACSEEDLDLADFESTPMYFGCPLKKVN